MPQLSKNMPARSKSCLRIKRLSLLVHLEKNWINYTFWSEISRRLCSSALCCSFVWSTMFFPPTRSLLSMAWQNHTVVNTFLHNKSVFQIYLLQKLQSLNIDFTSQQLTLILTARASRACFSLFSFSSLSWTSFNKRSFS